MGTFRGIFRDYIVGLSSEENFQVCFFLFIHLCKLLFLLLCKLYGSARTFFKIKNYDCLAQLYTHTLIVCDVAWFECTGR